MNKYFLVKLRAIGDNVILSSSINALKDLEPDSHIDIIIPSHSHFAFEENPLVRKIFTLSSSNKWLIFFEFIFKLFKIRKTKYDFVLNFHASHLSAFLSKLTKSRKKVIYNQGIKKKNLFSDIPVKGKGEIKSIIEKDYDLLRSIGLKIEKCYDTKIHISESNFPNIQDSIFDTDKKIIGIHPGASKETKKWITSNYVPLVSLLEKEYQILFLYSNHEKNEIKELKSELKQSTSVNFIKTETLKILCKYIKKLDLFLAMDSGPKHIAVALNVPTITLFSSESVGEFHPYDKNKHPALQALVPCRNNYREKPGFEWCGLTYCDSMICMKKLTPELIKTEISNYFESRM